MPGMNTGLSVNNPVIVSAFQSTLRHQFLIVLVIMFVASLMWSVMRAEGLRRFGANKSGTVEGLTSARVAEPSARQLLRISFGVIWIIDGLLQAQSSMPLGMTTQVIEPTAASSPSWVQHIVNVGATIWSNHPIVAPASAVWIQIGIGLLLLVGPRTGWSRFAGAVSAVWGIVVWIFGESFGGIFAPGLSWLTGAPGAVLIYVVAGILITLPEREWSTPKLGRRILRVIGAYLLGMALLQAWPGRGFWHGRSATVEGTLTSMVKQMSKIHQPHLFSSWLSTFGGFDSAHGFAVNLVVVIILALIGIAFLSARVRILRSAVAVGVVFCLAVWVLVQDFGFLGGVGTDPNSMVPTIILFCAGYVAFTKFPPLESTNVTVVVPRENWTSRFLTSPSHAFRNLAAVTSIGVVIVGAAPIASASMNPNADPIISEAINGTPGAVNIAASNFQLVNQAGKSVTLANLRHKAIALTFLDPVCVSDCPILAQELRQADTLLGSDASRVELVAIVANPLYHTTSFTKAFDQQENLQHLANWQYLTGSLTDLVHVWDSYGVQVSYTPGGAMIAHPDIVFVINTQGRLRYILQADIGSGTEASQSSFAVTLTGVIKKVLQNS